MEETSPISPSGEIGRHTGLKILGFFKDRASSSLASGTNTQ